MSSRAVLGYAPSILIVKHAAVLRHYGRGLSVAASMLPPRPPLQLPLTAELEQQGLYFSPAALAVQRWISHISELSGASERAEINVMGKNNLWRKSCHICIVLRFRRC